MKILKSMLLAATLMLLSASTVFCQAGILDVAMRDAAHSEVSFDIGIIDILQRSDIGVIDILRGGIETPFSPVDFPVTVQALDKEGNVIFSKRGGTSFVLPKNAAKLVVTQAGIIVIADDIAV